MSGIIEKHINGVDYDFWICNGTVSDVATRSGADFRDDEKVGHIDRQFSGAVQPPGPRNDCWNLVLVEGDDTRVHRVVLHDDIGVAAGDRVSLYYGRARGQEDGRLHGFKNHSQESWWSFDCRRLAKPERKSGLVGLTFRLSSRGIVSLFGAMAALMALLMVLEMPSMLLDPVALVLSLPTALQYLWIEVVGWTAFGAALIWGAYGHEVRSAGRRLSQAMLGMAMHTRDPAENAAAAHDRNRVAA